MECRVEFDYAAQESDELTLKKGDIITNVVQKMDGWWEGSLNGTRGMFPDNFVKTISPSLNSSNNSGSGDSLNNTKEEVQLRKTSSTHPRRMKALFSYAPEQDDELRLDVGDVIEFLAEVEEGWWRGKLKGKVGIFPSNFVKDQEPITNGTSQESGKIEEKANDRSRPPSYGKGVHVPDIVKSDRNSTHVEDEPAPELPPKPVREIARCFFPYQASNEDELALNEGDIVTIISKNCEDEGWWRGELRGKTGLFPDNFVKIISPNDTHLPTTTSSQPQQKILAQGRNISLLPDEPPGGKKEVSSASVVDGIGGSKILEKEKPSDTKFKFQSNNKPKKEAPSTERPPKAIILTPPVSPAVTVTPSVAPVIKQESIKRDMSVSKVEGAEDMEDFNAIERTEKLNHLTATRAKAPRRRPPSTIITRDNDINFMNGSMHPQENTPDSPPAHSSTPLNLSYTATNGTATNLTNSVTSTPSNSVIEAPSLSSTSSPLSPKEASPISNTSANSAAAAAAKQKKLLPWMAELKQTQDKKREKSVIGPSTANNNAINTSNLSNVSSISNISLHSPTASSPLPSPSPNPSPIVTTTTTTPKEREPAPLPVGTGTTRAPPLPAKPSTLITPNTDKSSPITSVTPPTIANKFPPKKHSPAPGTNIYTNSNSVNDVHTDTNVTTPKLYVSYEEHAKLRERVSSLENELETMKRQLKILLDRDLHQGHIV